MATMTNSEVKVCDSWLAALLRAYRIAGYFQGVYISRTTNSILVRESNGDTEPRLLHINYFSRF